MPDVFKSRDGVIRQNVDLGNGAFAEVVSASVAPSVGGATEAKQDVGNASLATIAANTAIISSVPNPDEAGQPVRLVGQTIQGAGFSAVGASVLDAFFVQTPTVGTGVSYNQATGALNILAGTTANAEFLARSVSAYRGSMRKRFTLTTSQRIANNNLAVVLADLIGEGLSVTINSATSITVAITGHTFNATNVGQFLLVGGIVGAAGVPGRYAIASVVAGVSITLTVAGWPASGSCTATLFGRNYVRHLVNGTTATNVAIDAQRNGWATGDTTATVITTASPGVLLQVELTGREVFFSNSLRASTTAPAFLTTGSRYENIPDQNVDLYVFLWSFNGTTAPASSTTWTIASLAIESFANLPMYVQGFRSLGQQNPIPISGITSVIGTSNEDFSAPASAVMVGGVVRTAVSPITLVANDTCRMTFSSAAQAIVKPFAVAETDWQTPAIVGGILNTATPLTAMTAAGASLRNHVTGISIYADALTNATDFRIREPDLTCNSQTIASNTLTVSATHNLAIGDAVIFTASTVTGITAGVTYYVLTVPAGTTLTLSATRGGSTLAISGTGVTATFHKVLWMTRIPTSGMPLNYIPFATPLRGSVNTVLQIQTATASGAGAVYPNLQGYQSP